VKEDDQKRIDLLIEAASKEMQRQCLVFLRTVEDLPADDQAVAIKTFTARSLIGLEQLEKVAERLTGE
jgi:hypothetical protein